MSDEALKELCKNYVTCADERKRVQDEVFKYKAQAETLTRKMEELAKELVTHVGANVPIKRVVLNRTILSIHYQQGISIEEAIV